MVRFLHKAKKLSNLKRLDKSGWAEQSISYTNTLTQLPVFSQILLLMVFFPYIVFSVN